MGEKYLEKPQNWLVTTRLYKCLSLEEKTEVANKKLKTQVKN